MIGFGQLDDCGRKPVYAGNKFGNYKVKSDYKKYKESLSIWNSCNKNLIKNLDSTLNNYFSNYKNDEIEGYYYYSIGGRNLMKVAIVKSKLNDYSLFFLEGYSWLYKHKVGVIASINQISEDNFSFEYTFKKSNWSYQYSNGVFLEPGRSANITYTKINASRKSKSGKGKWAGNGSGIIISRSGYIVTNHHVIDDASEIAVEFKYKNKIKEFKAKVIKVDKTNDLAIIKIDDAKFSNLSAIPYNFKTRSVDVGTEIFALGYPMALSLMGKDIKFTDGKISSKTGLDGDITTYQISAPIIPGNSGGPLFDTKGNLIGINSAGLARGGYESVGYSIKTSYLLNLIDVLPEKVYLPSSTKLASKRLTEQIKILSDYVVLIKVK